MYQVGKNYFIRTVTMFYTGRLKSVTENELLLSDAAWIADTGKFSEAMRTGEFNEVEPYDIDQLVIINKRSICDATCVDWELPITVR